VVTPRWIVALLAGALALTTAAALAETQEKARPADGVDAQAGWTTYRDARHGLSLTLPPGWHRARRSLTPQLVEPREILSAGSYRLRYKRRSRCLVPGCPLPALDGFGRGDVLISIQERRHLREPADAGFAPRRHPFALEPMRLPYPPGSRWRCARRVLGRTTWTAFSNGGRAFYAFVAIGRSARSATRRDARRVLESLAFTPAPPGRHS
jgi:hypothetical protein